MREPEYEDSTAQKPVAPNKALPANGTEQKQQQQYITVAARAKSAHKSTMLLAVLFGVGLLCLFFMIKKSTTRTAKAAVPNNEDKQVETAIARLTGVRSEMFDRMDEIVKKFDQFSDVQQVNVNELARNPFKHELFLGDVQEISDTKDDIDAEMMRKQQLRQQASAMQLLSIMQTAKGYCCMIDDKIVYEGDLIKGFVVSQIGDSFVKLAAEGTEIILKLSE